MTSIVDAFRGDETYLSLAQLVHRTELPKSTAYRMAERLVGIGWLDRVGGRYRLGLRLFELGGMVHQRHELREHALPFMQDLYELTHEIVHLGLLDGLEVLYIDKIAGHRHLALPTRVGGRMPLHCTALGKALLAGAPANVVDAVIAKGLHARTPYTVVVPNVLLHELEVVRYQGYAVEREESGLGWSCVAASVCSFGQTVAAISVCGPTGRIDAARLGPAVRKAALGAGRAMSGPRR